MRLKSRKKTITLILILIPCIVLVLLVSINSIANASNKTNSDLSGERILYTDKIRNVSGVWGKLELDPIIVQAKENYFQNDADYNAIIEAMKSSDHWTFKNQSLDGIQSLFLSAGLSSEVCSELIKNTKPISGGSGYITTPPDAILWNFTPEIRAKLYPQIGQFEGNTAYAIPYHYTSVDPKEWLYKSNLPKDITDKLEKLIYIQGNMLCISDLHLLAPFLNTATDWNNLLQTIFRSTALDVYLKIEHGQDVSKLIDYWGNLGRVKDIKPILEQMSDKKEGGKIDITELLPSIPKSRLDTFASIKETDKNFRDCKWTMFNFFNTKSDDRYNTDEKRKPHIFLQLPSQ